VPKPAFELWQPLASLVTAAAMQVMGPTLGAAQVAMAILGAAVAPLAWLIGRDAASAHGLDARRGGAVAITSGLLAAVLAPFVVAVAGPDSTTPFLVMGTLAAVLTPRAMVPGAWRAGIALGVTLGLAWLSRQEAIWLGLAVLIVAVAVVPGPVRARTRGAIQHLAPVVAGGLLVAVPWLVRTASTFGTPFAGQAVDNAWLRRNEDIFAWADPPTMGPWLAQGAGPLLLDRVDAILHQLLSVLILPAFPVGLVGLVAIVSLRRSPAIWPPTALAVLLLSGGLTFLATALLFPVATLWGTFLHAAGPLLVGLTVGAALGGDALLARVSARRGWGRPNVIIAPVALLALAVPLLGLQLLVVARQAAAVDARLTSIVADARQRWSAGEAGQAPVVVTDHPMWLASAAGVRAVALPDEPITDVSSLAGTYGAAWLLVVDERGRYPDLLHDPLAASCLDSDPEPIGPTDAPAWLVRLAPECTR
jgi:hypothetical protein